MTYPVRLFFSFALLLPLLTSTLTSAVSDFDDKVRIINSLEIQDVFDEEDTKSLSLSWYKYFKKATDHYCKNQWSFYAFCSNDTNFKLADWKDWAVLKHVNNQYVAVVFTKDADQDCTIKWYDEVNQTMPLYSCPSSYVFLFSYINTPGYGQTDDGIYWVNGGNHIGSSPSDLDLDDWSFYFSTYNTIYPSGYEGPTIEARPTIDQDGDGLTLSQEALQGTSDYAADTDGDGIDDLKESIWFEDRDEVFCDSPTTPTACAYPDPTVKDIYIEIDWMENSSRSFQPNSTQVSGVISGLGGYGYNVHVDTGEYGGGNALPYITDLPFMPDPAEIDYFDLKDGNTSTSTPANFNPNRKGVWRYLISGYNYNEIPESSGGTIIGSENVFISYGLIQDHPAELGYVSLNTAIAGTIVHETGHSLCLSKAHAYTFQSTDCQFSGIDTEDPTLTYDSVMNYDLQVLVTHLSYGYNGASDHDDWSAIDSGGIADFSQWTTADIVNPGVDIHPGLTLEQAKEAQLSGTFGKIRRGNEIYDYKKMKIYDTKTKKTRPLFMSR